MRFGDSRYSAQRSVRDRFDSRVYICRIFLFFSFQVIQQLRYVFPGLLFAEIFSWLKILMVEKLIVKNCQPLMGYKTILY